MTLDLRPIGPNLHGKRGTDSEIDLLKSRLPANLMPEWLMAALKSYALGGVCFSLNADQDESGIGAELIWLTPAQMMSETFESQPGKSVQSYGFLAIGACAEGSGDPYFLDLTSSSDDPPLVRIPHDYAVSVPYPLEKIEVVTSSLSEFLLKARLHGNARR